MAGTHTKPGELSYHPYAALVGYMEEPLTLRLNRAAGRPADDDDVFRQITRACSTYRERVDKNVRRRREANGQPAGDGLEPYLFNPTQWMAFGRTDAVSLILLDDFTPFFTLMAHDRFPVVQGCLSFCPRMDRRSLDLSTFLAANPSLARYDTEAGWPFDPPHEWFKTPPAKSSAPDPVIHPVQERAPLLVATRFKVGGLTALAGGVAFQWAVIRTLAKQVLTELDRMHRAASGELGSEKLQAVSELEITTADVERVRCLVLDGQGAEDLILLTACTNYSVGIELITRLRSMTLGDVFDTAPDLPERLTRGGLHAHALRWVEMERKAADPEGKDQPVPDVQTGWGTNHVFSDSYSSLGVMDCAFRDPKDTTVRGFVRVVAQIDANPGHMLEVEKVLAEAYKKFEAEGGKLEPLSSKPHRFLVGRHDYLEMVGENPKAPLPALRTRDFFRYVGQFARPDPIAVGKTGGAETGFMSFASSVLVPFPELGQLKPVGDGHVSVLGLLDAIHKGLFHANKSDRGKRPERGARATLTIERLRKVARRLRMPASLTGAVERLFQVFAAHLADPHVFDSVVDLYDVFAAIYAMIVDDLPRYQLERNASPFGQWLTRHLDDLLEAVRNALDHRVRLMLPNADMRDRAVDLRGGLSKMVAVADVPLKCGLYLVNRSLDKDPRSWGPLLHDYPVARVCGVTRFSFNPQTVCSRLTFPTPRLFATLRMDVMHVTRPLRFLAHVHEAAHLFYDADRLSHPRAADTSARGGAGTPTRQEDSLKETAAEVFAETLTHLLVFVREHGLFLRRYVADYGVHTLGAGSGHEFGDTPKDAQARFFLLLLRGFLVTLPIRRLPTAFDWPQQVPPDVLAVFDNPKRHVAEFLRMVEEVGPFHAPFRDWWAVGGLREKFTVAYNEEVSAHAAVAKEAWGAAYMQFRKLYTPEENQKGVLTGIYQALRDGRPIPTPDHAPNRQLDTVELVCRVLYAHTRLTFGHLDPTEFEVHLYRRPDNGAVSFDGPVGRRGRWGRFQLDGAYSGLFCADPHARSVRMRQQVAIHKTFWDISAHLRLERLNLILETLWPQAAPAEPSVINTVAE